jgi:hypothetical protein
MSNKKKGPPKDEKKGLREAKTRDTLNTPWKKSELLAEKAVRTVEIKGLTAHRKLKQFTQGSIKKKSKIEEAEDLRGVLHFAKALAAPIENTEQESKPAEPVAPGGLETPPAVPLISQPSCPTQTVQHTDIPETKDDDIFPLLRKGAASYHVQEGQVVTGVGAEIPDVETTQRIHIQDVKKPKKK